MCTLIKKYLRNSFHDATKFVKFVQVVPKKLTAVPPMVITKTLLSPAIFKKVLEALYRYCFVVVQAYSSFSLCCHLVTARASDSMFLFIDFVRVTNCFYDYDYDYHCRVRNIKPCIFQFSVDCKFLNNMYR